MTRWCNPGIRPGWLTDSRRDSDVSSAGVSDAQRAIINDNEGGERAHVFAFSWKGIPVARGYASPSREDTSRRRDSSENKLEQAAVSITVGQHCNPDM
jgi:hypothetical protein